jgi:uncharacterized protein (TIGR02284 family)
MINDYEATSPMTSDTVNNGTDNMSNDDVISTLNDLIETCKDGQEGFRQAAEGVERSDLKSLFFEFSQQRAHFAAELQNLVHNLGGDPETSGSAAGAVHRGWINLKAAITGKDEQGILNECERGEDSAKSSYKDALDEPLPADIKSTIRNQYDSVVEAHNRVKALRDSYKEADDNQSHRASTSR